MSLRDAHRSHARLPTLLAIMVALLFAVSIGVGDISLSWREVAAGLFDRDSSIAALIVREIRLPRTLLAVMVGATLGLAGAALQGLLRNPLADPGIIGVSSTAALGAVIALYFGLSQIVSWALPVAGLIGAGLAVTLILILAGRDSSVLTLILAGVAVNAFAGALTALAVNLAPSPFAAIEIVFWLLGSLADRSFDHVWLALPLTLVGWVLLASVARPLNALTLGEDTAQSLGFNLRSVRLRVVVGCACAVGAAVAVSGSIGFVGLVVPHLLRPFVGHEPARLLFASALGGAALLLASDIAIRLFWAGPELKLGVVTALIGAPFFLSLIVRTRRTIA